MSETQQQLKVSQEKLPASQLSLEIEIPPEMSQKVYEQVISKFMRTVNFPGFRKGKIPRQVLLQRLGVQRLKAATVEELVQDALNQVLKQENIASLGNLQLRSDFDTLTEQFEPGTAFTFTATIDVAPQVDLGEYKGLQVVAQPTYYDPAQVDQLLAVQQAERATLVPIESRPGQQGDVVLVDFTGRLEPGPNAEGLAPETAVEIPGGTAADFQLELVPGRFLPGFVEGIIGMNLDDRREISVTFPEDYFHKDLAGKAAVFNVTLKEIKEKELPSLDDEFAQEISEFKTLADLRSFLEQRFRQEAEQATASSTEAALVEALLKVVEVELPETLINQEVNQLLAQTATRWQEQGIDIDQVLTGEMIPELRQQLQPEAMRRLKCNLALAEIAQRESIQVLDRDVDQRYQQVLNQFNDRKIDRQRLREIIAEDLLREKVIEWLKGQAQIELVGPETAASAGEATIETTATVVETTASDSDTETTASDTETLATDETLAAVIPETPATEAASATEEA